MLECDGALVDEQAQAVVSFATGALCGCEERGYRRLVDCVVGAGSCGKKCIRDHLAVAFIQAERCGLDDQIGALAIVTKCGIRESGGADLGAGREVAKLFCKSFDLRHIPVYQREFRRSFESTLLVRLRRRLRE